MYLNDFCKEILEREKEWIDLSDRNLLNIYYMNGKDGLKEFYSSKKDELQKNSSNSKVANQLVNMIDNILNKIDYITQNYRNGNKININELVNLFLIYVLSGDEKNKTSDLNVLTNKALESLEGNSILPKEEFDDDYLYDDVLDS